METLVPPITMPNQTPGSDTGTIGGSMDISGTGLENLKPGTSLTINIQPDINGWVTGIKIENNNRLFQIPVKLNVSTNTQTQLFPENRPYQAEIRVMSSRENIVAFKLLTLDGRPADKLQLPVAKEPLRAEAPVIIANATGVKTEVQLHPLPLKTLAAEVLGVKKLPPELAAKLPEAEIELAFQKVLPDAAIPLPPETKAVVQTLKALLLNPQQPDFQVKLESALQTLPGKTFPAQTRVSPEINLTAFQTPLGEVISATPVKLDNGLPVDWLVKTVHPLQTADKPLPELLLSAGASLLEELALPELSAKLPESKPLPVTKLLDSLKPLNLPPETMNAVISKLPAAGKNMLLNMVNYVKAAVQQDVKQWLGTEVIERLSASGPEGREALQQLTGALASSSRETPVWRLVEIPFYTGEGLEKIRLAVKKYNDDEDETPEQQKQKYGTRFVVDTNFTKLGRFQFDGYSLARDKRFDLIIRTERFVGNDLCANIMHIFKTTLHEVGYVGTIKVNIKENFIKIGEDISNDILPTGIFI